MIIYLNLNKNNNKNINFILFLSSKINQINKYQINKKIFFNNKY
jgi:hypothetical protein